MDGMKSDRSKCCECGSDFGHIEGCSHVNDAMKRDALLAGKSIPVVVKPVNGRDDNPSYCDECERACTSGSWRRDKFFCCLCSDFDKADLCEHCAKVGEAA